ncbi:MAG: efflux RND transporter permease subunit [Chitinophagales bacterium]
MTGEHFKELSFTSWCIRNRTSIYVFTLIITIWGYVTYERLPKELFPDVVVPTISVATIYPGASPEDIENLIAKPLEKQLKSISGIKKVTSNSMSDFCLIMAEFNTDQDPRVCKQKVKDAIDKGKKDLPDDLKTDPQIQEFDISELPIMNINLAGDIPLAQLKKYAEDLQDKIESQKEITRVDIIGGYKREVQVNVDMYKMTASGISFMDIENAIARENLNISGGELRVGELRRNLRVTGEFKNPEDIGNIVVRSFTGNPVFIKDIAQVRDWYADKQDFARLGGKTVITLNVIKRTGENLLNATDQIYETLDDYKLNRFPAGLKVEVTGDTSDNTRIQLHDLINTVIIGFILVVFVLMFFMGFRNAFFVGLAVPLSCLVAFLVMPGLSLTMNVVVLFSFLLALGIIVDDAIVVIENTHRIYHQNPEMSILDAAKYAAGEVFVPVLAGTLTTLAPFVPLLFWPGVVGKFMKNLPLTLIITLGASLFVAFVINPVFAVTFMSRDDKNGAASLKEYRGGFIFLGIVVFVSYALKRFLDMGSYGIGNFAIFCMILLLLYHFAFARAINFWQEKIWPKVVSGYRNMVRAFIKGRRPIFIPFIAVGLLIASVLVFVFSKPVVDFFPTSEPNFVYVYCKLPMGTDANVTDSVTRLIEQRVFKIIGQHNPDVTSVISNVGLGAGDPQNPDKVATPQKSKVTVAFKKYFERKEPRTSLWLDSLRGEFKSGVAGASISVEKESNGPPVGKPVNIEINGDDFAVLLDLQHKVEAGIQKAGIRGIEELKSDLQISKPEILVDLDEEKLQREGLSRAQVAVEIRTALFGKEVSKYRDANDDAPIQLRLREDDRTSIDKLLNLNISFMDFATQSFRQVPVSSIAKIHYGNSYSVINRKNQKRLITLSSDVSEGFAKNEVVASVKQVLDNVNVPEGYEIKMTGEQEQQMETQAFLGSAFGIALALMFMIMVFQFNSAIKPIIIASTVIFSLIGVFLGNAIFHMKFSIVMTGVGFFSLAGIVIRNGILLIEFIDELRQRGLTVEDAVIEGGATRITPVILTAMSAILGLIPLAIGLNLDFETLFSQFKPHFYLGGDNVAFWGPLAWTMIFGLSAATFLTLLVVPAMYILGYKTRERLYRWFPGFRKLIGYL